MKLNCSVFMKILAQGYVTDDGLCIALNNEHVCVFNNLLITVYKISPFLINCMFQSP